MAIDWIAATWHPRVNVFTLRCDCGARWGHWSNFSQVRCPRCGARAWLHANEAGWDERVPEVRSRPASDNRFETSSSPPS